MTTELMKQRQELFCQAIIKGHNQSDAYRVANPLSKRWKPETIHKKANLMMSVGEVQSRLKELQADLIEELKYTKKQHFDELDKERKFAKELKSPSTSLKATELKGKLCGHYQTEEEAKFNIRDNQIIVNFIGKE